ncbi:MAG: TerB family tellurite resistance protein [Hydrogenophaga sp.]|uniref:tellurite resistance TerB family protein n=1 Tax=Hydrogenophaga sp. TaxID=1904254 RepID=UPI0025B8CB1A|nr:TerB family tellurite resistance protein [Hydrogenophaga sp.]MBT9551253.1 TerB family tellurite resistance protein [Hydrogenophaga sp.]
MRSYPTDSPEAAARLLAMALVADGQYSMNEIKTIDRLHASQRLGMAPEAIKAVIDGFCEDLLLVAGGRWAGSAGMDEATRERLLAEVQDPALQETVWHLCEAVALSDGHLADGEVELLDRMAIAWRHPAMASAA